MTILVGHTNGTDTGEEDHDTTYGTGTALVVVLLGLLLIGTVVASPYFFGEQLYTPIYRQQVVLTRADTPVVQGRLVPQEKPTSTPAPVVSPGHTIVAVMDTPDLSCLKSV